MSESVAEQRRIELARLRAEVERSKQLQHTLAEAIVALRAEVERLTQRAQMWADEAARRSAEVEGLKALLRAVRTSVPMHNSHATLAARIDTALRGGEAGE